MSTSTSTTTTQGDPAAILALTQDSNPVLVLQTDGRRTVVVPNETVQPELGNSAQQK
ncbi:MAG: hypothetical protein KDA91_04580 [Planctomycetaceae bacterium]|nr:hypothetical protein [Planctomycetaceae bacterium]